MCGQCHGVSCTNAADIDDICGDVDTLDQQLLDDEMYDVDNSWNREGISFAGAEEVV